MEPDTETITASGVESFLPAACAQDSNESRICEALFCQVGTPRRLIRSRRLQASLSNWMICRMSWPNLFLLVPVISTLCAWWEKTRALSLQLRWGGYLIRQPRW